MLQLPERYRSLADADTRQIEIEIDIGSATYTSDDIISCKIYRSIGSGGLAIGNAISDYCQITLATNRRIKSNVQVIPYVRFLGDPDSGWLQLGVFWVTDTSAGRGQLEIIAYDKMYTLDKRCTYLGSESGSVSPLPFPCTMQQLLKYTCDMRGLECDFRCADFTVETRPVINLELSGDDRYYTHRQMLGYIAGVHGANVCFDNKGKLVFRQVTNDAQYIEAQDCIDQNIDSEEPFTVLGVRLQVGENNIFINDTGELYNEDMEGIIEHSNPLGSIAAAEYIWKQLGNFSYCSCDFTRRGRGWIETGDLLTIDDNIDSRRVHILVQSIELEFSADRGFTEHITSEAETSAESGNRIASNGNSFTSSGSDMAVYYAVGNGNVSISNLMSNVVSVKFSAVTTCVPLFAATIPMTVTTAGTVKFTVVYDGTTVNTYSEYCPTGLHFKTITLPLIGTANGGHSVSVWVSSTDAAGTVDAKNTYATVNGSGLEANAAWDGTITARDTFTPITLTSPGGISLADININYTERVWTPLRTVHAEKLKPIELTADDIELAEIDENVDMLVEDIPHAICAETVTGIELDTPKIELGVLNDTVIIQEDENA